jgi:pimeloyl-ACP methyl ester carboxylesterase
VSTFTPITFTGADGLTLYARDYASGGGSERGPVICIHGLTRNSSDFEEVAPRIAALGRRVLAVDVRGRGNSERDADPANYSPPVYARDVIRLMDELRIARAVFIGTSMGGLITMTLATRHLDRITAAVLNDIGPIISEKGLARIASYAGKCPALGSWREAVSYVRDINQRAFPHNDEREWDKWAHRAFEEVEQYMLVPRYDPNIAVPLQTGKLKPTSLEARTGFRRLARGRPVLLVRGALSDLLEPRQVQWMQRTAPDLRYIEVPNVGHAPMLTEPQAWEAIRDFLSALP